MGVSVFSRCVHVQCRCVCVSFRLYTCIIRLECACIFHQPITSSIRTYPSASLLRIELCVVRCSRVCTTQHQFQFHYSETEQRDVRRFSRNASSVFICAHAMVTHEKLCICLYLYVSLLFCATINWYMNLSWRILCAYDRENERMMRTKKSTRKNGLCVHTTDGFSPMWMYVRRSMLDFCSIISLLKSVAYSILWYYKMAGVSHH